MLTNMLPSDLPKENSFKKFVKTFIPKINFNLKVNGPKHSTMEVGSNKKSMIVKRSYIKPQSKLACAMAKGKAKAKARARERALARVELDLYYMEPSLGPNIFDKTNFENDSASELTFKWTPTYEWINWCVDGQKCVHI